MTTQQTFDIIVAHLRSQGEKSYTYKWNYNIICAYRSPSGLKCAVGCLIPDEMYNRSFEGKSCQYQTIKDILYFQGHNILLVRELQIVHDEFPVAEWEEKFQQLAEKFRLKYVPRKGLR